jgi:hypothetical protein
MTNQERCKEISQKIYKMANALMKEGESINEQSIIDLGTMMAILGGAFLHPRDCQFFVDIFDMYSAKKVLLSMGDGKLGGLSEEGFTGDDPTSND